MAPVDILDTVMTTLYETNIDDMDPRLWPHVIGQLLKAGALDAWLTPIIMKKGRPAFTLSALCDDADAAAVRATIFGETTTIGIREVPITRHVLDRSESTVEVAGQKIGVKTAHLDGKAVNRSVEWDDVVTAAHKLGLSAKDVLAAASAAATNVANR
jgi:uncharacterized protein (DUF111 family)